MTDSVSPPVPIYSGTDEHKRMFCGLMLDAAAEADTAEWPALSEDARKNLAGLPWDATLATLGYATCRIQALADRLADPLIRQAMARSAFEQGWLKVTLRRMMSFYGVPAPIEKPYGTRGHAEWLYLRTGYGQCVDVFVLFGLIKQAKSSVYFPPELSSFLDSIAQIQTRQILFFINWIAYKQAHKGLLDGLWFSLQCLAAFACAAGSREYLLKQITLRPGALIEAALAEQERRFAPFDPASARPLIVPRCAKIILMFARFMKR